MPLAAASEQGPDFVEVTGAESAPAKSKSILPLVLIGVGVVAVAAVLFLVVLKTNYDIVGNWTVVWQWTAGDDYGDSTTFSFVGTKESGTTTAYGDSGPYTVDGKKVTWTFISEDPTFVWTGEFDSKDAMSGTMNWSDAGLSGTWTATRVAVASIPGSAATVPGKSNWKETDRD
ncbi:MAG TPA: hypothetical protein VLQ89_06105, partial [Candidatus Binatia bacterium]|nr:hypothetical protein [Candidatus Binatia bacterium]